MRVDAIILAAGSGTRMQSATEDKILASVRGVPLVQYLFQTISQVVEVEELIIVCRSDAQHAILQALASQYLGKPARYVRGGSQRQDSVRNALAVLGPDTTHVLIHDGARPLVSPDAWRAATRALQDYDALTLAHRVTDTIKRVPPASSLEGAVELEDLERSRLWAMETPQGFSLPLIRRAYSEVTVPVTDDVALVSRMGLQVHLLENPWPNPKITLPGDLAWAEVLIPSLPFLQSQPSTHTMNPAVRVGFGYDIHRFASSPRPLILGGIEIPGEQGLDGHSDADVLLHAVSDAILGALGEPDIGHHFPNTDPRIAGIDSVRILEFAGDTARKKGFRVGNLDAMLVAKAPKLSPHIPAMRQRIAQTLGIEPELANIKATTNEGLDALGRGEGIAAYAAVTLFAGT